MLHHLLNVALVSVGIAAWYFFNSYLLLLLCVLVVAFPPIYAAIQRRDGDKNSRER